MDILDGVHVIDPYSMTHQGIGWTLIGIALQFIDAWWYIFLGKNLTRLVRYLDGCVVQCMLVWELVLVLLLIHQWYIN